jgi:hypothetical protein
VHGVGSECEQLIRASHVRSAVVRERSGSICRRDMRSSAMRSQEHYRGATPHGHGQANGK